MRHPSRASLHALALPSLLLLHGSLVRAAPDDDTAAAPHARRTVHAPRLPSTPVVDCDLGDEAWRSAALLDGFVQTHPGDNARAWAATEVRLGTTARALHVSIRAEDDPSAVRAGLGKRDGLDEDDVVSLYLDTLHDGRRAYVLMVNPLGVQQDGIVVEGRPPDLSIDLVFESKGCLTAAGYAIEVAVPFESLRFEAGTWGLHVLRQRRHRDEETSWMPLRRDKVGVDRTSLDEVRARLLAQAGTVTGIDEVDAARRIELIPVATSMHTGRRTDGPRLAGGVDVTAGLTARVRVTPGLGVDLAVNPDFAEIEADQLQLTANQRFPLLYEEKRPFFLDAADLLQTPTRAFYSRAIVDPAAAAKATGQWGRTSAAVVVAADAAPGSFSEEERRDPSLAPAIARLDGRHAVVAAARVRRDIGEQSSLAALATTYTLLDRYNHVAGIDGRVALGGRSIVTFQLLGSISQRPFFDPGTGAEPSRRGAGVGYHVDYSRASRRATVQLTGEGYTPDYRADLGYTQRTDTNRWSSLVRFNSEARPGRALISWSAVNSTLAQFDWRGRMQYAYTYPRLLFSLTRQTSVSLSGYQDYVRVFEEEFGVGRGGGRSGTFAGERGERSTAYHGFTVEARTAASRTLSLAMAFDRTWNQLDYDLGAGPRFPRVSPGALDNPAAPMDPGPGSSRYATVSATYRPVDVLSIGVVHERSRLVRNDTRRVAFDQQLWSLRLQYAFSRFTSLRVRLDGDSVPARLSRQIVFAWTPGPSSALYVGYNEIGSWIAEASGPPARLGPYVPDHRTFFVKMSWAFRSRLGRSPRISGRPAAQGFVAGQGLPSDTTLETVRRRTSMSARSSTFTVGLTSLAAGGGVSVRRLATSASVSIDESMRPLAVTTWPT